MVPGPDESNPGEPTMPKRPSLYPTEAELEILQVLWEKGPSTVRQVHDALQGPRKTGLTTTLKLLQVMEEKGFVVRSDERPAKFRPAAPQEQTQAGLLEDLVQKAFDGSMRKLLVRAVQDGALSGKELAELRGLIDQVKPRKGGK